MIKQASEYSDAEIDRIEDAARKKCLKKSGLGIAKPAMHLIFCVSMIMMLFIFDPTIEVVSIWLLIAAISLYAGFLCLKIGRNYSTLYNHVIKERHNYCSECGEWKPFEDVCLWSDSTGRCNDCAKRQGACEYAVRFENEK